MNRAEANFNVIHIKNFAYISNLCTKVDQSPNTGNLMSEGHSIADCRYMPIVEVGKKMSFSKLSML